MCQNIKQELKSKISNKINELVDCAEKVGNINYFEISIKHVNGELIMDLRNTYKEKLK